MNSNDFTVSSGVMLRIKGIIPKWSYDNRYFEVCIAIIQNLRVLLLYVPCVLAVRSMTCVLGPVRRLTQFVSMFNLLRC